jgi:hypothetical protein
MNITADQSINRYCVPVNSEQLVFVPDEDLNEQVT